ncbi:MAG: hypothetical protein HY556_00470 [Euryarchaeota archaeon]|nr:hypothetical protein [Euryarchaeota archaeon]
MMDDSTCIGEVDIDSDKVGAFMPRDERFVGKVAGMLASTARRLRK